MKLHIYSIALPILAAVGFAQDKPPVQPTQPASTLPARTETQEKPATIATQSSDKTSGQSADRMQEMKTQTYSGSLVDVSCAGTPSTSTSSADRTAPPSPASAGSHSCALSAGASQFALQMKDGQTVRFDDVGNTRAQEAMKNKKKWSESAAANKPVRVKVSAVLSGDKLTVMSID